MEKTTLFAYDKYKLHFSDGNPTKKPSRGENPRRLLFIPEHLGKPFKGRSPAEPSILLPIQSYKKSMRK